MIYINQRPAIVVNYITRTAIVVFGDVVGGEEPERPIFYKIHKSAFDCYLDKVNKANANYVLVKDKADPERHTNLELIASLQVFYAWA